MAPEAPESELAAAAPSPPEKIGPADLERLNQAIGEWFEALRFARGLPAGETHETQGRPGAVVALRAAWGFLMQFEPVLAESLHAPLINLANALLALNENNVEPILKPTKRTGRATSSPRRYALIGIAVGLPNDWNGLASRQRKPTKCGSGLDHCVDQFQLWCRQGADMCSENGGRTSLKH